MNKQEKEYTVSRIEEACNSRLIVCECKAPSLESHLKRAAANMELKPNSSARLSELAFDRIVKGSWGGSEFKLRDIFREPSSYKEDKAKYDAEKKSHLAENRKIESKFQAIIDRVNLNEFESGRHAIAEAMALKV